MSFACTSLVLYDLIVDSDSDLIVGAGGQD